MATSSKCALVTGASGHLGANLVRHLLERGYAVRALVHRDRRALEGLGVELAEGDVTDAASIGRAVTGVDLVFHCAAKIQLHGRDLGTLRNINIGGTANLITACRAAGVARLIHVSSIEALDPHPVTAQVDESRGLATGGLMAYAATKIEAECLIRAEIERGMDAVILYPTAMIGPYDFRPSHAGRFLLDLARGALPALVTGGFDWVDVRDVATSAVRAAEIADPGGRFLLSGRWASAAEIGDLVCAHTGARSRLVMPRAFAWIGLPFIALWSALSGTEPLFTRGSLSALAHYREVSHAHAAEVLGHAPRDLRQTLTDSIDWLQSYHHGEEAG
jgi:nucleoside-diphosphate-sugar epimerase